MMYLTSFFFSFLCAVCGTNGLLVPRDPPPPWQAALMARYIIHNTGWISIATISTQSSIKGYPFVSLKSLSDGPVKNSTGIPYLYMTEMDVSGKDIESDKRVTIMASLAETDYCESDNFDPQDPRCAKVLISGTLLKIKKTSPEYQFGKEALFEKHPSMKNWPADHQFYVAKVSPQQIEVLDYFGGLKMVTVDDYFSANITDLINLDLARPLPRVSVLEIDNF
ncbi:protein CREG1 [Diabrotica virgifera virgifera]|uniref:CREG-like beta-barrel domain-containing protein n=1 Tax=Diabrotica virgifera virgifera TaxID=50390 RepID=A0ABM5KVW3_DIAVI|nr:protein CREG1 [Diabrotica virgifera virgifera]